ncbi:hypothetical protein HG536_0A02850 [Torulaspora globosa]|uniref:Uncharacterized protein n=1 Tax=Torulaspora globosa TaxID=48254 RepID=A0A7G3ZAD2_9SACH|nr:uncharacterized protein HG536_0A02850 [Torulaspora globosa]QLL30468.1 hypothetical protein HG536_0A02850 [Torulaspora globosa]
MSEEDDKRAKQLEEARKRVEELKKRNKKDKKKKKQTKETEKASESKTGSLEIAEESSKEPEVTEEENVVEASTEEVPQSQDDTAAQSAGEKLESNSQKPKGESPSNDTSQLFSDEDEKESDFMTTIQKQNEEEEIRRLQAELDAKASECKTLKFVNMEQETTIEELEAEVKRLLEQVAASQQELSDTAEKLRETETRLAAAEQLASNAEPSRLHLSQFSTVGPVGSTEESTQHHVSSHVMNIDREALDRWRNWNVDMSSWRSIGAGPIVEF